MVVPGTDASPERGLWLTILMVALGIKGVGVGSVGVCVSVGVNVGVDVSVGVRVGTDVGVGVGPANNVPHPLRNSEASMMTIKSGDKLLHFILGSFLPCDVSSIMAYSA